MAPKTVGLFCVSLCLVLLGREGSAYEKCSVTDASGTVVDVNICDGVLVCCKEDKSSCCNSTITVNTPVNILHKSLDYSEPKDKGSRDSQAAVVPLREMNAAVNVGQDNVVRDIRTTSVNEMRIAGHRDSAWYRRIM
ncbi:hypothetical protein BaRGS_00022746 [Batillaria attramentaria]|uniref:Uncharacterized protein n=1 Tax=Batillaria attramentaria TaxID=370345 RepID=A0ABD0KFX4_9CAEN